MGFEVVEVDGHNVFQIHQQIELFKAVKNGIPKLLIANTTKGKGVSYMENKLEWHYLPMKPENYEMAVNDVKSNYL